jgi:hypothetical protein
MLRLIFIFAVLAFAAALMMGANAHPVFGAFLTAYDAGKDVVSHSPYMFAGVLLLLGAAWLILSPKR